MAQSLIELTQALPQEIFDKVYKYFLISVTSSLAALPDTIWVTGRYRPPGILRIDPDLTPVFADQYYRNRTFFFASTHRFCRFIVETDPTYLRLISKCVLITTENCVKWKTLANMRDRIDARGFLKHSTSHRFPPDPSWPDHDWKILLLGQLGIYGGQYTITFRWDPPRAKPPEFIRHSLPRSHTFQDWHLWMAYGYSEYLRDEATQLRNIQPQTFRLPVGRFRRVQASDLDDSAIQDFHVPSKLK